MTEKKKNKLHALLMTILVILAVFIAGAVVLLTHTQFMVGAIQNLSQGTVNTKNLFEPLHEPLRAKKDNGQYILTEIKYSDDYPNSFLDITYPDEITQTQHPTLIYFHGGGFFGGSKCDGDPLAENDATALLDDICSEGFNLVNIDYALVPDYHFPTPLIQANEAFRFLMAHADEYLLDMDHVVIMGSSAGAIMASQMGSIITNPEYAALLGIEPVLSKEQVAALVIDDAPLDYNKFSLGTKILIGNYMKGSVFLGKAEIAKYNNILSVTKDYIPCVLLGSEYREDMNAMAKKLKTVGAEATLVDPYAQNGVKQPHCFVAQERENPVAAEAFKKLTAFLKEKTR